MTKLSPYPELYALVQEAIDTGKEDFKYLPEHDSPSKLPGFYPFDRPHPNVFERLMIQLTTLSQHQHVVIGMRDARRVGEHLTHAMAEGVDRRAEGVI